MSIEENLRTLQLNLVAPIELSHAVLDGMLAKGQETASLRTGCELIVLSWASVLSWSEAEPRVTLQMTAEFPSPATLTIHALAVTVKAPAGRFRCPIVENVWNGRRMSALCEAI